MTMPPGIYVHVPFCASVCPYCDFAVRTGGPERRARWVRALVAEVELLAMAGGLGFAPGFDTLYLGGGTPSRLARAELEDIVNAVGACLDVAPGLEIFVEANPEDVTRDRLADFHALGVKTLSLGVQSLDDARLKLLGRAHTGRQARTAVELALAAGFETVSFDLIYGLPGETREALAAELDAAIALAPDHLSAYQLSMPEATPFGRQRERGEMTELPEVTQAERFVQVHETLASAGYPAYEVSNFARNPRHRSRHNQKYWSHTPYLGLGPAAHSFDGERRWWNERDADRYEERIARGERPVAGSETLTSADLALERVMLGLRTVAGIALADCAPAAAARAAAEGLVTIEADRVRCTLPGWAIADALAARLAALAGSSATGGE